MDFSRFKVLTLDVVGTLIDYERGIGEHFEALAHTYGVAVQRKAVLDAFGRAEMEEHVLDPRRTFVDMLDPIQRRMNAEMGLPAASVGSLRRSLTRWPAFPDSVGALARLGRRYRLAALTNADRSATGMMAATLSNPFRDIFTAEDVGASKPSPLPFLYALEMMGALGYEPEEILHVAQSQYHDIATAQKVGLATCWIDRRAVVDDFRGGAAETGAGFGATPTPAEISKPDFHFHTLAELADAAGC